MRTDHIGRPVFATDDTGTKVWEASYLPFGGVRVATGDPIDLRFPGQWFQAESGLHQNWMREYDPTTGRYVQADPLGLIDGSSVYGYARQNPGVWVDPTGEFGIPGMIIGGIIGGVSAYVSSGGQCPMNIVAGIAAGAVTGGLGGLYSAPRFILGATASGAGQWAGQSMGNRFANDPCCRADNLFSSPRFWATTVLGGVGAAVGPVAGSGLATWRYGSGPQYGAMQGRYARTALAGEAATVGALELGGLIVPSDSSCGCN